MRVEDWVMNKKGTSKALIGKITSIPSTNQITIKPHYINSRAKHDYAYEMIGMKYTGKMDGKMWYDIKSPSVQELTQHRTAFRKLTDKERSKIMAWKI